MDFKKIVSNVDISILGTIFNKIFMDQYGFFYKKSIVFNSYSLKGFNIALWIYGFFYY